MKDSRLGKKVNRARRKSLACAIRVALEVVEVAEVEESLGL
jgi:hypothetical protein